ncbi:hypothetical protein EDS67_22085 [candidate division KSB1 bacterium]|nr:MAG: hypothetical protein EDS67_22085 [candidate division KSB1 bacterium]MCE7944302.1 hypothetical protein [Chlorobi bacterium CHB1]MDL1878399.1 hypothetical protein [Cytophagia bacterium CHB2]
MIEYSSRAYESAGPPPFAEDAEKALLGAVLMNNEALKKLTSTLRSSDFYVPAHQKVFYAIVELANRKIAVDAITLADELSRRGQLDEIGGRPFLSDLVNGVISSANVEVHTSIILEKARKRRRIELLHRGIELSRNGSTEEEFSSLLADLQNTRYKSVSKEYFMDAMPPKNLEIETLVPNFAFAGCVTLVAGKSGTMKSLMSQWLLNKAGIPSLYVVDFDLSNHAFHVRQNAMQNKCVVPVAVNPDASFDPTFGSERFWQGLGEKVKQHHARVVVFDTVLDFLSGEYNRAGDLNFPLQKCREFAARNNVAEVWITHTKKTAWDRDELTLADVSDSRVLVTKSDLVLLFQTAQSARKPGAFLLKVGMAKNRLGKLSDAITYRVDTPESDALGHFDFIESNETFPRRMSAAVAGAIVDLEDLLRDGPRPAKDIEEQMKAKEHSPKIIRSAREEICKKPVKVGDIWFWELK